MSGLRVPLLLAACLSSSALVVRRPALILRRAPRAAPSRGRTVIAKEGEGFDVSAQQFDLLALRSFRRDTILQYDATNQSEPLRIALTLLGILFSLSLPALAVDFRIDELTANAGAVVGTGISGALFARNRAARQARMEKIEREYAMGDLRATYRGRQTSSLREQRNKRRVVVLAGDTPTVDAAVAAAFVYRRRLTEAGAFIVPVYTDGGASKANALGEVESRWLWAAAEPQLWRAYFEELLSARGMAMAGGGAWIGLNLRGRTFGSAVGAPRWDELLGTGLQPVGDGFGEFEEPPARDATAAAQEAAAAAVAIGVAGASAAAVAAAAGEAAELLAAQASFYQALNSADVPAMKALWDPEAPDDSYVSDVVRAGSRVEAWEAGSNAFPPSGMRATDVDALVLSPTEGWTTAVERPAEGGTLLATQVWRRDGDGDGAGAWRLAAHRYIPWSADGATAVAALRCDRRGCVLIGRQINTRAP